MVRLRAGHGRAPRLTSYRELPPLQTYLSIAPYSFCGATVPRRMHSSPSSDEEYSQRGLWLGSGSAHCVDADVLHVCRRHSRPHELRRPSERYREEGRDAARDAAIERQAVMSRAECDNIDYAYHRCSDDEARTHIMAIGCGQFHAHCVAATSHDRLFALRSESARPAVPPEANLLDLLELLLHEATFTALPEVRRMLSRASKLGRAAAQEGGLQGSRAPRPPLQLASLHACLACRNAPIRALLETRSMCLFGLAPM